MLAWLWAGPWPYALKFPELRGHEPTGVRVPCPGRLVRLIGREEDEGMYPDAAVEWESARLIGRP